MIVLGIETSCDETAAAVVQDGRKVISSFVHSQIDEHKLYGGVVPEIASRMHIENVSYVVNQALKQGEINISDIDTIAVTAAPGLIGALLVGVSFGKSLAYANNIPLVPVHHIRGHIASVYLENPDLKPPFMALVVSGGHSHIVEVTDYTQFKIIGRTMDDAPGEAFDKVARTLGFPYPGGVYIDRAASKGDGSKYKLPTPQVELPYHFSFSGLKTAVINLVHNTEQKGEEIVKEDLAATFQNKVAEILTDKTIQAMEDKGYTSLVCAGGVSANSGLRNQLEIATKNKGYKLYLPSLPLCGDNAAMIASQGYYEALAGNYADTSLNAYANYSIEKQFK